MRPVDLSEMSRAEAEPSTVIGGLPISVLGLEESARILVRTALRARGRNALPFYSTSANGQVIALAAEDPVFKQRLIQADQIQADGMPMVRLSGYVASEELSERVATTDLVHAVARLAQKAGLRFYFFGATPEGNRRAVANMQTQYPGLIFAGARDGYYKPEEEAGIVAGIVASKPDILWIGLGVPREQEFVSRNLENLRGVGVIKTSGGLFDFLSGKNSRAPQWMQNAGLEWVYRTMIEPQRLLGRYLKTNPAALWQIIFHSK
ncbi:MAG TPA: WecB/TagA/CpsF family glycosyltransferase [Devosia sp.]|nr:WecB/TagA/CpsF family glycosyltransferase [Devosia sp.]